MVKYSLDETLNIWRNRLEIEEARCAAFRHRGSHPSWMIQEELDRTKAAVEHLSAMKALEEDNFRLLEALEAIADCECYTRAGGATHGDLGSYEKGLDKAISIANEALTPTLGNPDIDGLVRQLQKMAALVGATFTPDPVKVENFKRAFVKVSGLEDN